MNYTKEKVWDYLKEVLGDNVDGLYISLSNIEDGIEEEDIYTNSSFDDDNIVFEETLNCEIRKGITRLVIIPKNEDYVIKMSFTGVYDWVAGEAELTRYVDEEYDPFNSEKAIYNSLFAVSRPVFLENIYLGNYFGIDVYIQEKIERTMDESIYQDLTEEQKEIVTTISKTSGYSDNWCGKKIADEFISDIIEWFGQDKAKLILADCANIDDLHNQNYGYLKNGQPVIYDYGGFDTDYYGIQGESDYDE